MEAVAHRQVVALVPSDLPAAQSSLVSWTRAKIIALGEELREQRQNLAQAKRLKWKHTGWTSAISRTRKRMIYFAKIQTALRAGFLIVPNFDVEVIAVRVANANRSPNEAVDVNTAAPQLLPPGIGQYVDNQLSGHFETRAWKDSQGRDHSTQDFHPTAYDTEIDFPATLVKPVVMEATQLAMDQLLFDRIGIVRKSRRSDPIVVGQIIDPATTSKWQLRSQPKCVTFFVAWWLDTRDL
jgi:hypothetical protein